MSGQRRIAVVTGGGGGIGGAIAEEMGRAGWFVVTVDPLVTLDGTGRIDTPQETTADRIVGAGGSAMASAASVTDGDGLATLFADLAQEHGDLDAVVNVAGITRQTGFAHGTPEDWHAVLDVHLGGFLNVLAAALPIMAQQGRGTILGVTSGSGWRAANAGAYSCAKRAIASLVWQLGRLTPPNVTINAISPIAATRMVAAAAERARKLGGTGAGGGLSLFDSMPQPEDLAPLTARLAGDAFRAHSGRIVFTGGSEMAVVEEPHLLEIVRLDAEVAPSKVLEVTVPKAFVPAEQHQRSEGGANPRFGSLFGQPGDVDLPAPAVRSCLLVSDRPTLVDAVKTALKERSIACHHVEPTTGFGAAADALRSAVEAHGPFDAIVLMPKGSASSAEAEGWRATLEEHTGINQQIEDDAGWARAVSDDAKARGETTRLLTLTDAVHAGGRSRAQAAAQLARSARDATEGRVVALAVGLEDDDEALRRVVGDVVGHLLGDPESAALAGAELALRSGWFGLRSHPRPTGSITYGGPDLPDWFDEVMTEILEGE